MTPLQQLHLKLMTSFYKLNPYKLGSASLTVTLSE